MTLGSSCLPDVTGGESSQTAESFSVQCLNWVRSVLLGHRPAFVVGRGNPVANDLLLVPQSRRPTGSRGISAKKRAELKAEV